MRSLKDARKTCEKYHPGLIRALKKLSLADRESADSQVVEIYRRHGGPGLLVPQEYAGPQASAADAVKVQRAVGSLSPSLAVASVMHHFTVAMLFSLAASADRLTPEQLKLMSAIATDGLLLASGWAEGRTDQNILLPTVVAEKSDDGYIVNGSKKPCSLSASMDVLTASVAITDDGGRPSLALLLIPAGSPGISTKPFWTNPVLGAAQSHEVTLTNVKVPTELVISSTPEDLHRLDDLQTAGFTWFELLTTAAYIGTASALVEMVLHNDRGTPASRAALGVRLEAAVNLVDGTAKAIDDGLSGDESVAAVLTARYATQDLLASLMDDTVEMLGGLAFMRSFDISYLSSAVRALAFHPPSRVSVAEQLAEYYEGHPLRLT
ncbi:acyl-CoA dehydrogenase family protein [Allorhizocola rhizosphaerae]|uniref:acyl-CoA dehydrogenase family protein n=1 Tax=Allorhizocola rhizosphaerae TaxID=1872709 RepID=UPI000E3BA984|nr:acyl-CoA dehydrogenase family protein [Allorhizocola rhizosphaerae]